MDTSRQKLRFSQGTFVIGGELHGQFLDISPTYELSLLNHHLGDGKYESYRNFKLGNINIWVCASLIPSESVMSVDLWPAIAMNILEGYERDIGAVPIKIDLVERVGLVGVVETSEN